VLLEPADISGLNALPIAHLSRPSVLVRIREPHDHVVCGKRLIVEISDRGGSIVSRKGIRFGMRKVADDVGHRFASVFSVADGLNAPKGSSGCRLHEFCFAH
jgi:hypothetical protein